MVEYYIGEYNIKDVQRLMLEMLIEVDKICQRHGIRYVLDSGTLLGAVRHQGFIPWDDDIDIAMLREDYDKFCTVANIELPDNFVFETMYSRKCFPTLFGKCFHLNTRYVQQSAAHLDIHHCVFLDVFIIDNVNLKTKRRQCRLVSSLNAVRCLKLHTEPFYLRHILYLPLLLLPIGIVNKLAEKYMTENNKTETEFVCPICQPGKPVLKRTMFTDTILANFMGYRFPIPSEYEEYLKRYYQNPMDPPPADKRYPKHGVIEIKL